ncbi:hypothetical protein E2562_035676 [Oryza meyeriana var. granulata]|uniref:MADS-box domain-containing protein n=1 Tax=Oryza meyeriana var. granulata TaxID=110450 RepID=A0A6G1CL15_9ORYZ|nr:hypothetical protein E2562_035676 [Oryza meyeriana var. granulata]
MVKGKASTGRKKIEIKRIEKANARDVCFSKRRRGLFNKAGELSMLCDANIACVVFSPAGRGFSFGHPSIDDVADRLASMAVGALNIPSLGGGSHDSGEVTGIVQQTKLQHMELQNSLETEENRKEKSWEAMRKEMGGHLMPWLNLQANLLGLDELEELHNKLSAVHDTTGAKLCQTLQDARGNRKPLPQPHMEMAWAPQLPSGGQVVTPMNADLPGSSYGLIDDIDANYMFTGVQGAGGSGDCLNAQFGG